MGPSNNTSSPILPIAIVVGFAMIAMAIFFTQRSAPDTQPVTTAELAKQAASGSGPRPVTETDYIRGNPNAPIVMIEYSDYDCAYCKQFHDTLNQVMDEYGVTGKVAWVYRQFPIADLHPNSPSISAAALCVGKIAGNQAFWDFTDSVFDNRDVGSQTNMLELPNYAAKAGVDPSAYAACVKDNETKDAVLLDAADGAAAGATGTPYTLLLVGDQKAVISGSQSYDVVKGIIDNLIAQLDGTFDPATASTTETRKTDNGTPML